jgi:hypothetical protein
MKNNLSDKKEKQIEDDQIDSCKNIINFNADQSNKNNEKNL